MLLLLTLCFWYKIGFTFAYNSELQLLPVPPWVDEYTEAALRVEIG